MVGSIDPRCETVRGTHWPKKGREVVWSSRRGNHLGQRSTDRINRPDIWMQAIRSDSEKLLWHGGRPHMGPGARGACHRARVRATRWLGRDDKYQSTTILTRSRTLTWAWTSIPF